MKFLEKIQRLPVKTRKTILWLIVFVLAAGLFIWWLKTFQKRLSNLNTSQFIGNLNFPEIKMPQLPEINKEEIEKIKESLEENGQQNQQAQ